jgi:hypothetical protein
VRAHGVFRVGNGGSAAARGLARLLRLPAPGDAVDVRLLVEPCEGGERWRRTFDGRAMNSRQYPAGNGDLAERFGLIEFRFRREGTDGSSRFRQTRAAIVAGPVRIPLPHLCAPAVTAREDVIGESTRRVDVRIALPLVGTLLTYQGIIDVEEAAT